MPASTPDPVVALLDEATSLARDPVRAIEAVLAAWRLVRASALAAVVDELVPWLPVRELSSRRRKVWRRVAAAGRVDDVPALLGARHFDWFSAELITMLRWPLDPRVTLCLATDLPEAPAADRLAIIAHLIELGDPRTVTPVCAVIGSTAAEFAELRRRAEAATLSPAATAALARFRAARAAHLAEERALIAEVHAAPDDDGPRLVYGDWLQGHQDPRGEFIALQYRRHRGKMSEPERRRERDLIAAHGRRWQGGLAAWCTVHGFERGFVSAVRLATFAAVPCDCPDWATVSVFDAWGSSSASTVALLTAPVMRSLRAVVGVPGALVGELGPRLLGGLHRLELGQHDDSVSIGDWFAAVLARGHALEHVVVHHGGLELRLGPGPGRLTRLELTRTSGDGLELQARLEALLAALPPASITVCAVDASLPQIIGDRLGPLLWVRQPDAVIEPLPAR